MKIELRHQLATVSIQLQYETQIHTLANIVLDTGSSNTILKSDILQDLGIALPPTARIRRMYGIGGIEPVVEFPITAIGIDEQWLQGFPIQVGAMDYVPQFNGILGLDFLRTAKAIIDLEQFEIRLKTQ